MGVISSETSYTFGNCQPETEQTSYSVGLGINLTSKHLEHFCFFMFVDTIFGDQAIY